MNATSAAILESAHGEAVVLEEVQAEASINDLLAEVTVKQRYRNTEDTNIEAVYTFPLPLDGVLLGLEVEIGDRKLVGTVVEKSDAERRYENAITDGDAAILLEQAEPGLYTASVGNLLPGETVTIRFRYGLLLRWNGDFVRFMMPTTIAPRYGDPAAAGLLPHQSPEHTFDAERSFKLRVEVRGILKDARFNSPSHDISIATKTVDTIIDLEGSPAMDRDFVLEARASQPKAASALLAPDLDGWVALASFRPEIPDGEQDEHRSVKIVVDCSGSMGGDSIAQARAAIERILDGLRQDDLFEIMAFGSSYQMLFGREMPVSEETLAQARSFVRDIDANMGGTEIEAALDAAYEIRSEADLSRDLLLITDGETWNRDEVFASAKKSGHRIFTVGVGSSVAESFVAGLAEATGGACELVSPREDMAERVHRHFQRMYAPPARSVNVSWPAPALRSLPNPLQTVYGGDTLHVFGWFDEKPEGTVSLDVTLADGRSISLEAEVILFEEGLTDPTSEGALPTSLARIGAGRLLARMDNKIAATEHAVRYQLMSEWTNYIVVHVRAKGEKADDLPKIAKVSQVIAAGWHGIGRVLEDRFVGSSASHGSSDCRVVSTEFSSLNSMTQELSPWDPFDITAPVGPENLVELLNAQPIPPFPTVDDFETWGLSESIIKALRDLVERGEEEEVVLVLLYILSESEAGRMLERRVRRQILKACKTHRPDAALINRMRDVFRSWQPSQGSRSSYAF
jgi:Ca-activated chloride channel homolog